MEWSQEIIKLLRLWLRRPTWQLRNPSDRRRFHDFIWAVWEDEGKIWDEDMAREIMTRELHALHPDCETRSNAINAVCLLGTEFTRFLSRGRETSRIRWPDPRADRMVEEVRQLMTDLEEEDLANE